MNWHLLVAALAAGAAWGQPADPVDWLREHAVVLRTIDPTDEDYSDLQGLKTAIGDARIVQLGEQTHGDGACFHAKSRLAKFLHAEMGFDLIVFESGFYDCSLVEAAFHAGEPALEAAQKGVFGIWAQSEQVRDLFEYIAQTHRSDRPLEVGGFDSQFTSGEGPQRFGADLAEYVDRLPDAPALEGQLAILSTVMDGLVEGAAGTPDEETLAALDTAVVRLSSAILAGDPGGGPEARTWLRRLANARAFANQMHWSRRRGGDRNENMLRGSSFREPFMAETLVFICRDLHPDRRIMTWGASSHLMHNSATVDYAHPDGSFAPDPDGFRAMGDAVREALGEQVYTIGFLAHSGMIGRPWSRAGPIERAPAGSLDELCHRTGERFIFIDFRAARSDPAHWLMQPRVARPRGYAPMRAVWPNVCDAMVFTDRMYPSTRAHQVEQAESP